MVHLYLLEDDKTKTEVFAGVLSKINQNEGFRCISGFGNENLHEMYKDYDRIITAIHDEKGMWLLDIYLLDSLDIGMKLYQDFVLGDPLMEDEVQRLEKIFGGNRSHTYLACVISVVLKKMKRPFDFISTSRILAFAEVREILEFFHRENIQYPEITSPDYERRLTNATRAIAAFIRQNSNLPHIDFWGKISSYTMQDLHISDKLNYLSQKDFEPIKSISEFLCYPSLEEFGADFQIWKNPQELSGYSPNVFEEMLKGLFSKNFTLFSMMVFSWNVFRNLFFLDEEEKSKGDGVFKSAIKLIIKQYYVNKRDSGKDATNWEQFVRYGSNWAPKSNTGFRDNLSSFCEMMQVLLYNPDTRRSNLAGIVPYPRAVKFHLNIDGDRLIERMNEMNGNLLGVLDGATYNNQHQTTRKIIKYWVMSQMSNSEMEDHEGGSVNNVLQWGSDSGFFITNRKGGSQKLGITLNFTI